MTSSLSLHRHLLTHRRALLSRRALFGQTSAAAFGGSLLNQLGKITAADNGGIRPLTARSCIFVFYYGGPSHLETWDPKPQAPDTVRGEFQAISTSVPGIQISEHLPQVARVMHHCAIVRSMHHANRLHDSASTEVFTGRPGLQGDREEFSPIPQFFPSHGAIVSHLTPRRLAVPSHVALPWLIHNVVTTPCQGGGFLGQQYDPLEVTADFAALRYQLEALRRLDQLSDDRILRRTALLDQIDQPVGAVTVRRRMAEDRHRALELLSSTSLQHAVDLSDEPQAVRERYGMTAAPAVAGDGAAAGAVGREFRGQNLLLARRLVEAGVSFVNVNDFRQQGQNWDSHANNFHQHRRYLLPEADRGLAALIEDLHDRGLLETTLVVACGEFGRTPTINASAGRDHWPDCYSILLAGGGIRGGQVLGSSDRLGAFPETDPVTPADLAATICHHFGLNPETEVRDSTSRPHRIATGSPMLSLFG